MSVGTSEASLFSRGYSTMMLPVNMLSTFVWSHSEAGTNSGTNSACKETVSYFSRVNNCAGGCRGMVRPFLRVFFGSSAGSRTGCLPTCAISRRRKGPSMRKRQTTLHGFRFVMVTYRLRQETMPGICAPISAPPCVAPLACVREAAGCGTEECVNLNIAQRKGWEASVPSSSASVGSKYGKSSAVGSSFLSTVSRGITTSPTQSTTSVEMTSPSGCSAKGFAAPSAPGCPLSARERVSSATSGEPLAATPLPSPTLGSGGSASESSSSSSSMRRFGRARTSSPLPRRDAKRACSASEVSEVPRFIAAASNASRSSVKRPLPTSLYS
mmetsp:Transcript_129089/g.373575  ORF Transcript_129089/g.373575 Transcript_129089/m.373575 type:complete len:327 (-) Transcript_129089:1735-2715(-)